MLHLVSAKKQLLPIFNFQISKILLSQIFLPKTSFNEIRFLKKKLFLPITTTPKISFHGFLRFRRTDRTDFRRISFRDSLSRRKVMRCKHHFSKAGKKLQNLSKASIGYSTLMRVCEFFRSQEMLASYF